MKITIVEPGSGWILSKIAKRIHENLEGSKIVSIKDVIKKVSILSHENAEIDLPIKAPDVIFYVDIQNCFIPDLKKIAPSSLHIGLFTHLHENKIENIRKHWLDLDAIVHMASRYYELFFGLLQGMKREIPMRVIIPGESVGTFQMKKTIIGIFQRGADVGKGRDFMGNFFSLGKAYPKEMEEFSTCLKFVFVGSGWPEYDTNILCVYTGDTDYKYYKSYYSKIDYLLIPSLWEGGPMALQEALAQGIPVISSRVGQAGEEFPVFKAFDPGDHVGLFKLLYSEIVAPKMFRRNSVSHINYANYARSFLDFIEEVKIQRNSKNLWG